MNLKNKPNKVIKPKSTWTVGVVEFDGKLYKADIRYAHRQGQVVIKEMNLHPDPILDIDPKSEVS